MTESRRNPRNHKGKRKDGSGGKRAGSERSSRKVVISGRPPRKPSRAGFKRAAPLPPGIELSPPLTLVTEFEHRKLLDTFLANSSRVHTRFREILQGAHGGYQDPVEHLVLAHIHNGKCSAGLAILPGSRWLIHSVGKAAIDEIVGSVSRSLSPRRIEGEPEVVHEALGHPALKEVEWTLRACLHLEHGGRPIPRCPIGQQRLAQLGDIPRLEQYASEFEMETGEHLEGNWRTLIGEKRILLAVADGSAASVVQKGPSIFDRLELVGLYTFPPFRRRGMASGLVCSVISQAAWKNKEVSAICPKECAAAADLLQNLGFRQTGGYLIAISRGEKRNDRQER